MTYHLDSIGMPVLVAIVVLGLMVRFGGWRPPR
jgi:hypothetical protein